MASFLPCQKSRRGQMNSKFTKNPYLSYLSARCVYRLRLSESLFHAWKPMNGQTEYLILSEDGVVLSFSGEFENDEGSATILMDIITLNSQLALFWCLTRRGLQTQNSKTDSHI
ncbi:hypothetical protein WA026_006451 [Henosepilachna vigintioctopunctata]|uniref:Uncharacterized protein n=1 Tax=Henosepilachna vigintioctopunctata TaxID=420089 RepID=A0AAW1U8V9_9CUCU